MRVLQIRWVCLVAVTCGVFLVRVTSTSEAEAGERQSSAERAASQATLLPDDGQWQNVLKIDGYAPPGQSGNNSSPNFKFNPNRSSQNGFKQIPRNFQPPVSRLPGNAVPPSAGNNGASPGQAFPRPRASLPGAGVPNIKFPGNKPPNNLGQNFRVPNNPGNRQAGGAGQFGNLPQAMNPGQRIPANPFPNGVPRVKIPDVLIPNNPGNRNGGGNGGNPGAGAPGGNAGNPGDRFGVPGGGFGNAGDQFRNPGGNRGNNPGQNGNENDPNRGNNADPGDDIAEGNDGAENGNAEGIPGDDQAGNDGQNNDDGDVDNFGNGNGDNAGNGNGPIGNDNPWNWGWGIALPWWQGQGYCQPYYGDYLGGGTVIEVPLPNGSTSTLEETPVEPELPQVKLGARLTLRDAAIPATAGVMVVQVGDLMFPMEVESWQAGVVRFSVPQLFLVRPAKADFLAVNQEGKVITGQAVQLIAPPQPSNPARTSNTSLQSR